MNNKGLCVRCNYAYATTVDDNLPVCEECKQKFSSDKIRKCPVDNEDMKKLIIKNVLVDKCPKCNGIWLDGDEVELLGNIATNETEPFYANREEPSDSGSGKFWKGFIVGAILTK